jgi:hypothetical protein
VRLKNGSGLKVVISDEDLSRICDQYTLSQYNLSSRTLHNYAERLIVLVMRLTSIPLRIVPQRRPAFRLFLVPYFRCLDVNEGEVDNCIGTDSYLRRSWVILSHA